MRMRYAGYALLAVLAFGHMVADISGWPQLKGAFLATAAAPAPKVFTTARGLETFSSQFEVRWTAPGGEPHALALTPEVYSRLRGPYARRNVYGAALSYGPVLAADPRTRPMLAGILTASLAGDAPLLRELGIDPAGARDLRVVVEPRVGTPDPELTLELRP